jgi:hypothetical protein
MLNDQFVLEQARHFARRVMAGAGTDSADRRIELAFRIALGRPPSPSQLELCRQLLADHAAERGADNEPAEPSAETGLAHLCHMLLNSNEFLYVP